MIGETINYDAPLERDEFDRILKRVCNCGHELYLHGNTMHMDGFGGYYIATSVCCFCDSEGFNSIKKSK